MHLLAASVQLRVPDERFPSHGVVKFLRAAAASETILIYSGKDADVPFFTGVFKNMRTEV